MNNISEAQIETLLNRKLKLNYKLFLYLKIRALAFNGFPDRLILLPRKRLYFVELKRPKGGILSPVQLIVHKTLGLLGFPVRVILNAEHVDEFIMETLEIE